MNDVTEADMKELNRRFEDHLDDYRVHIAEDVEKHRRQDEMHERNLQAIADLTEATKGVVEGWIVANGLQRFAKWLGGFAFFAAAIVFFSKYFSKFFHLGG